MPFSQCPKCNAVAFELVESVGALYHRKCFSCGYEEQGLAHFVTEEDMRSARDAYARVTAFLRWDKGRPSAAEILGSRKIVDSLRDMPLMQLKAMFAGSCRYEIGACYVWQLAILEEAARPLGMHVESEPLEDAPE